MTQRIIYITTFYLLIIKLSSSPLCESAVRTDERMTLVTSVHNATSNLYDFSNTIKI